MMPCHPKFAALQKRYEGPGVFRGLRLVVNLETVLRETPEEFRQRFADAIHKSLMRAYRSERIDRQTLEAITRNIAGRVLPITECA